MEKRRKQVLAASFLAGAFAVTAGFAVQGHARAAQYRRMLDNTYQHAFTELATAAGELDVALRKVTYATSPRAVLRTVRPGLQQGAGRSVGSGRAALRPRRAGADRRLPGQNR
ncbi:MAG: hypothetical protein ACLS63_00130 [Flavonifractor plautii]